MTATASWLIFVGTIAGVLARPRVARLAVPPAAVALGGAALRGRERWDAEEPLAWTGRYGEYLTAKVARVFPELFAATAPTALSSSYADGSTRSTSTSTSSCVVAPDDITTPRSGITSE